MSLFLHVFGAKSSDHLRDIGLDLGVTSWCLLRVKMISVTEGRNQGFHTGDIKGTNLLGVESRAA